jgi:hypothetical protein
MFCAARNSKMDLQYQLGRRNSKLTRHDRGIIFTNERSRARSSQIWRQLEQDRSAFAAQKPVTVLQKRDAVLALRGKPLPVGYELGGLPGKDEFSVSVCLPTFDRFFGRGTVEDPVQLRRVELRCIEAKLVPRQQLVREKWSAP